MSGRTRQPARYAAALVSALLLGAGAQAAAPAFDAKPWLADHESLKKQLEQQYSHLAWFGSPQGGLNLPQLDRHTQKLLRLADNDGDAKEALLAFVSAFHDGHLRPKPAVAPAIAGGKRPIAAIIGNLNAVSACAAIGVGSTSAVPFSLPIEALGNFTLTSDGVTQPFRAGVLHTDSGAQIGVVRIASFVMTEYPALCLAAWATLRAAAKPIDAKSLAQAMDEGWLASLAATLKSLHKRGASMLLVDVGGNGGGGDTGDSGARLFTSRPVRSAPLLMAAAPASNGYLDEQLDGLRKAQATPAGGQGALGDALRKGVAEFEARKAGLAARACDMSWVWREQRPWSAAGCSRLIDAGFASGALNYLDPVAADQADAAAALYWPAVADTYRGSWNGPVYVLSNAKVASAAEMFTAVMRDNGIAKVVGAPTLGLGCGNMLAARIIVLPHSQLRFQAPDCVRLRADGSDEVAGITPDLPLLGAEGESGRARAVRLFDMMEADLKAGK